MNRKNFTLRLTLSAILIAIAMILSFFKIYKAPFGGSVTVASMVPLMFVGYLFGGTWSIACCGVYGVLQFVFQGYPMTPWAILLDYVFAFALLGVAGYFRNISLKLPLKKSENFIGIDLGFAAGIFIACLLRSGSHFVSGLLFWYMYAPEGMSVELYSLLYQLQYMPFEFIITTVVTLLLLNIPQLSKVIAKQKQ